MSQVEIDAEDGVVIVRVPPGGLNLAKAQAIPQRRFSKPRKAWLCKAMLTNFVYLREAFPGASWTSAAMELALQAMDRGMRRETTLRTKAGDAEQLLALAEKIKQENFKTPGMDHQITALAHGRESEAFAYLMDQGTGKTWVDINDSAHNWRRGAIDAAIVLCPNSVKEQWPEQMLEHMPDDIPYHTAVWYSQGTKAELHAWRETEEMIDERDVMLWLFVNFDALILKRLVQQNARQEPGFLQEFARRRRCKVSADESTKIGNRSSARTKAATRLRQDCPMARIMTGTPIIKKPVKGFSQFGFLDPDILGFGSFFAFRNHHCVMGGYKGKQIVDYKNLDELSDKISSCSFRVLKDDCMDLPPRVGGTKDTNGFQLRRVVMGDAQRREYKRMTDELIAMIDEPCDRCEGRGYVVEKGDAKKCGTCKGKGKYVRVKIALAKITKQQQITSGFIFDENGEPHWFTDKPPKVLEVCNLLEEAGDQSVVIWSAFQPEIDKLTEAVEKMGLTHVGYHGRVPQKKRPENKKRFQDGTAQVLIGSTSAGGIGTDLWRGSVGIYPSCTANTEERVQSEDRIHRRGSEIHDRVTYYEVVVPGTVDMKILRIYKEDVSLSQKIMRDGLREWTQ